MCHYLCLREDKSESMELTTHDIVEVVETVARAPVSGSRKETREQEWDNLWSEGDGRGHGS